MEAEVAALSQLQLQLLALASELRLLREQEHAAREELRDAGKRWEEAEEERRREARQLRAEVEAQDDALRRLESRVRAPPLTLRSTHYSLPSPAFSLGCRLWQLLLCSLMLWDTRLRIANIALMPMMIKCLENENEVLEKNEKNLKESMEGLLHSREAFIKHYEDSTCSMQWTIQMKDKQIAIISEKLNSHLVLFSLVEKEAAAVKQVLGDVQCLVGEKENVVADLKDKVQRIAVLEKDFVEKLNFLENKISSYQLELRNRARIIYELKDRLEAEKISNSFQPEIEELKKALLVKDEIIERLMSEKQAMHMELHNMETALQKFQDIFSSIGHEGMKNCLPVSESQDLLDVNKEQLESIPGTQCGLPNEHTSVTALDEAANTPNIYHQVEMNPVQSATPPKASATSTAHPEPLAANTDTVDNALESKGDIDMGNLSPAQPTDSMNLDPNSENQS